MKGCCASPSKREPARPRAAPQFSDGQPLPPPGMAHVIRWQQESAAAQRDRVVDAVDHPSGARAVVDAAVPPPDRATGAVPTEGGEAGSGSGSSKRRALSSRALSVVGRMASLGREEPEVETEATSDVEGCGPCEAMAKEAKARATRMRQLNLSSQQVMSIAMDMARNIDVRDRKHRLRRYPLCFLGAEAVRWMIRAGHASTPEMAVLLGRVMEDEGLLSHFFREHRFDDTQNFYVFLGPCATLVEPGSNGVCGSAAQLVFSTAEKAVAAAAAAEAACTTTPGCRLLRFLHEHDIESLYGPLFQGANMDYHDVMLAFAQPDAEDMFIQLGLDGEQFAALQLAVSASIDRRLEKFGRGRSAGVRVCVCVCVCMSYCPHATRVFMQI